MWYLEFWAMASESLRRMFACLARVMHSFTFHIWGKQWVSNPIGMFVCWIHMWVGFWPRCAQIQNVFILVAIAISRSSASLNRESVMCAFSLVSKLKWKPQKCFELKRKRKLNFPTYIHIKWNRSPTHYSEHWDNKSLPAIIATCSFSIFIYGILDCFSLLCEIFIRVESQFLFRRNSDRFE